MSESDPETIDAGVLLVNDHLKGMAVEGEVTQLHRGDRYAEEGDRFSVDGVTFEVTDVTERTMGDLTDEDARREGSPDLEHYRKRLDRAHEDFEWDDDSEVVRHRFEQV
jgi:hypothetical protein